MNLHFIRVKEQENERNRARREQDQSDGFFPEQDEASPRLQSQDFSRLFTVYGTQTDKGKNKVDITEIIIFITVVKDNGEYL